jgi:ketosteroid isomerase-like protein
MTQLVEQLMAAMNDHDLDAAAGLIDDDYVSEQPAHPGRAFVGAGQMRANWEAIFSGIPDFHADIVRSVQDRDTTWTEWHWSGTRSDGAPFDVRGVTLFTIRAGKIVEGTLYMEDVERGNQGIEQAVQRLSGRRPRTQEPPR